MKVVTVIGYLLGAVLGFVGGVLLTFLCTPLLWKLEDIMHIELAGHSGPSEWVLIAGGLLGAAIFFVVKQIISRASRSAA